MFQRLLKFFGIIALFESRDAQISNMEHNPLISTESGNGSPKKHSTPHQILFTKTPNPKNAEIDFDNYLNRDNWATLKTKADKLFSQDKDLHAEESLRLIRRALALNPAGEWLNFDKGMYETQLKMNKEAIESFSEEIHLASTKAGLIRYRDIEKVILARSHFERGVCFFREKKFRQGFADLDLAEGYDHKKELTKNILLLRESTYYQRGLEREIILEKLMEPSPEAEGRLKHLVEVLDEKIRNTEPSSTATLFSSGNVAKHLTTIHQQLTQSPPLDYPIHPESLGFNSPEYYQDTIEGEQHLQEKRFAQAVASFDKQLSSGYGGHIINNLRGLANLALGKTAEAVIDFDDAVEMATAEEELHKITDHRSSKWYCHNRGVAYAKLGRFDEALDDFSQEISYNSNPESLAYRGIILKSLGREKEAEQDFEAIKSHNLTTLYTVGIAAAIMAAIIYSTSRAADPQRAQDQQMIADSLVHRKNESEIKGALKALVESIFIQFESEETEPLLQIEKEKIKEICDELSPAKNLEDLKKIITDKYGEDLSEELKSFFEDTHSLSLTYKQTRITANDYPQNFVYNAAIKSERPVTIIDQPMLKKYLRIFDELLKEKTLELRDEAEKTAEEQKESTSPQTQTFKNSVRQLASKELTFAGIPGARSN